MAKPPLRVDTLTHGEATRKNAPTAELEPFVDAATKRPIQVAYERRNPDLDPQLVWRGKDVADWSDLVVNAPPLYIQEKIHPKAIIEDLKRASTRAAAPADAPDLFADFNGIAAEAKTEFYAHDQHWSNRMILGDGLQVMASLAEREGLKGQVQCIYIDPPYGIKFNSNFQWSTTSRDVKDGKADHLTREPEQVKAFRDTWRDGIHSYLTYLRDRLTVARDLLTESGSIFVQIGDENVHRVRALMDEVFGDENFVSLITFIKTSGQTDNLLASVSDYVIWFSKNAASIKYRQLVYVRSVAEAMEGAYTKVRLADGSRRNLSKTERDDPLGLPAGSVPYRHQILTSQSPGTRYPVEFEGTIIQPTTGYWKTQQSSMPVLIKAGRVEATGKTLSYVRYADDYPVIPIANFWQDTGWSLGADKTYVVQTGTKIIERCIQMTTDPGDLVLDPTCGSGTTAYVAEQWGRRWITIDTSRVALALARSRIMGARYPWYLLADSREGQMKEAEITRSVPRDTATHGRVRQGFVYKRVPHITLKSIANNAEINTIWDKWQPMFDSMHADIQGEWASPLPIWMIETDKFQAEYADSMVKLNVAAVRSLLEQVPIEDRGFEYENRIKLKNLMRYWNMARISRQKEIDASIAAKAETEYLYDQPYDDKGRVRVAGPFTVESLSPHRVPAVDIDDSLFDQMEAAEGRAPAGATRESLDFTETILSALKKAGVQQPHKEDRIKFDALKGWPGDHICAEGQFTDNAGAQKRAAILIGPEYGTVSRPALTAAAREAAEAGFELMVAVAFNFDAHAGEFEKMGALTVLKARINPDLHMPELADTGAGNLFTVFGEPDIKVHDEGDGMVSIEVAGIDMYKAGAIESTSADEIAVWFIDTDYNYESFFVRHAYFPGANDPYKALKTTLKAEIDEDAWASLKRTRSRPFPRPDSGRVAVKVINHLGDEVMKVLGV
ncbi:site-specific DNA-methyltransferase [Polymorphobacter fuscus]|uniref:site-specific DNA-methyltransferase (adenine-specific) n=1 Tax=Sandarakinorhabdus fusca TaxID=1439888 RepID=A0A7C9KIF8_9SPHN|nr:DNA methyltransferase [Polymorphobacter fuscus]KAB7646104.1 site-specific DNA-methyltransferase [Polymorphobacter fuscus]MQT17301.1 site-specific DNA-methyltransferase [Polymorphobacter fuscus]NJC10166.1 adenine-specific DNA-methyltransferase [Polymorphobacter fuscus]